MILGTTGEAALLQERITSLRAILQPYPLVAALKAIMRRWTGDSCWDALRPPLTPLPDDLGAALADRLDRRSGAQRQSSRA